jgi:septal ring factor EnvC (AmiA/AmiB activator)
VAKARDITVTILCEISGDLAHLRERAEETTSELKALRKQIHEWQETTATATGFALHVNIRGQAIEEQLADLRERVEKLEKAR